MIIDTILNDAEIVETNNSSAREMRISDNAAQIFFKMFTKNTYSNPIGSIVREITSNCFDSHIEANVVKPILLRRGTDSHTRMEYISFIDFGVGMSPDRIKNVYEVLFTSTKQNDNTQIGGFGLGSKSCLAYYRQVGDRVTEQDNSFFVITIYDSKKYTYCIYEGPKTPLINLMHVEECLEGNGTEVRIPVLGKDMYKFETEIVKQLYYFDSIIFEGFENYKITNEFNVLRGKNFVYRGSHYSDTMHICLGKVAYPINYDVLELDSSNYSLPIAIKLEIGDVNVITSREAIDYSEATIKLLVKKMNEAKAEIETLISAQYDNVVTLKDYFNYKANFGKLYLPNNMEMDFGNLYKIANIKLNNFVHGDIPMISDRLMFNNLYRTTLYGKKVGDRNKGIYFDGAYSQLGQDNLYLTGNAYRRKVLKHQYIRSKHETNYLISANPYSKTVNSFAEIFNVERSELSRTDDQGDVQMSEMYIKMLAMVEAYQEIVEEQIPKYEDIVVPETFKTTRLYSVDKENITISMVYRYDVVNRVTMKFTELAKFKGTIIYTDFEKINILKRASDVFEDLFSPRTEVTRSYDKRSGFYDSKNKAKVMFIMVSKANMKRLKQLRDICDVDDIYSRLFYRKADLVQNSYHIGRIFVQYSSLDPFYRSEDFKSIFPEIGAKLTELTNFLHLNQTKQLFKTTSELTLERFFKIDKDKQPAKIMKYFKTITKIDEICKKYSHIFQFINIPNNYGSNPEFSKFIKSIIKI
jgi:hypothetical protein